MTANGPILRDIHVAPASWWPPAPGWWIIVGVLLLLVGGATWWWLRRRAPRAGPNATSEVDALAAAFARDRNASRLAEDASALLRRVARRAEPAAATARGKAWREFLARYAADATQLQRLDALQDSAFRRDATIDAEALLGALRGWCAAALRGHSRGHGTRA